jgi:CrcB protein
MSMRPPGGRFSRRPARARGGAGDAICSRSNPTMKYLLVFIGGGLGAALRHFINGVSLRLVGTDWPAGTLFINVTGSILMGLVAALFAFKLSLPPALRLFIATGILGGYTTFSTFSLETALLFERGQAGMALLYASGSVLLGVAGLFAGMWVIRALS